MKNILIDNTGFINKGAELMLRSIVDKFKDIENVRLAFKGSFYNASWQQRASLNLYSTYALQRFKLKFSKLFGKDRFEPYGLILEDKVDVVIDAGGFQFGDQWITDSFTKERLDRKLKFYKRLKKNQIRLVFLPQAVGPFENAMSHYLFRKIYALSDLFFVRDRQSYEYAKSIVKDHEKLLISPDFTNIYKPVPLGKERFEPIRNHICIVPNSKMITHTSTEIASQYIEFLKRMTKSLQAKNYPIFYLNHEGREDLDLIQKLNEDHLPYFTDLNADEVKYIIGQSRLLISSRFHGVVSGLSQSVPTFCTSWSHKYEELLHDYDFEEGLLDLNNFEMSEQTILKYLNDKQHAFLVEKLSQKAVIEKEKTLQMWTTVENFIF